jgi:hypothetical protein
MAPYGQPFRAQCSALHFLQGLHEEKKSTNVCPTVLQQEAKVWQSFTSFQNHLRYLQADFTFSAVVGPQDKRTALTFTLEQRRRLHPKGASTFGLDW